MIKCLHLTGGKMNSSFLKKLMLAAVIGLFACIAVSALSREQNDISKSVIRLHVIANSDSKEDQQLKLNVRDAILKDANDIFENINTKNDASIKVKENINKINTLAKKEIKNQGFDYNVVCSLEKTYFPTRQYENFTLPAGEYDALKVVIGKGEGKNWWCVMFPPLCTNGIENKEAIAYFEKNLSKEEFMLITSSSQNKNIEYKFKIIELFEDFKNKVKNIIR